MSSERLCPDCNKQYDMQLIRCPHCGYDPFKAAAKSFAHDCPPADVDVIALLLDRINNARKARHGVYAVAMEKALFEIESLRARVEALSQYPEEAVRAVVVYASDMRNLWSGNDFGDNRIYKRHADNIAAIFKEKQGV